MQKRLAIRDTCGCFKIKNWPRGQPRHNQHNKKTAQSEATCSHCETQCVQWDRSALSWKHCKLKFADVFCSMFAQTVCANCLHRVFVQSDCVSCLHKLFAQAVCAKCLHKVFVCTSCLHTVFVQSVCTKFLCKSLVQKFAQVVCTSCCICTNNLCKVFVQIVCTECLCKQFVQTLSTSCLCNVFVKTVVFAQVVCTSCLPKVFVHSVCTKVFVQVVLCLCKLFVWSVCAKHLHKVFAQTVCANCLCEVQTACASCLHKLFHKLLEQSVCFHKVFVQHVCTNSLFLQIVCAVHLHKFFAQSTVLCKDLCLHKLFVQSVCTSILHKVFQQTVVFVWTACANHLRKVFAQTAVFAQSVGTKCLCKLLVQSVCAGAVLRAWSAEGQLTRVQNEHPLLDMQAHEAVFPNSSVTEHSASVIAAVNKRHHWWTHKFGFETLEQTKEIDWGKGSALFEQHWCVNVGRSLTEAHKCWQESNRRKMESTDLFECCIERNWTMWMQLALAALECFAGCVLTGKPLEWHINSQEMQIHCLWTQHLGEWVMPNAKPPFDVKGFSKMDWLTDEAQECKVWHEFAQTNTLHKCSEQTLCTNTLHKHFHFVQTTWMTHDCTGDANPLSASVTPWWVCHAKHQTPFSCGKFFQNGLAHWWSTGVQNATWVCANKIFAETLWINTLHKHFVQVLHTNTLHKHFHFVQTTWMTLDCTGDENPPFKSVALWWVGHAKHQSPFWCDRFFQNELAHWWSTGVQNAMWVHANKHFAQTLWTNTLHKHFAQTLCANTLCKQFAQKLCSNSLCKCNSLHNHFVQTPCTSCLCKHNSLHNTCNLGKHFVQFAQNRTNTLHKQLCKQMLCTHSGTLGKQFEQTAGANETACASTLHTLCKHFVKHNSLHKHNTLGKHLVQAICANMLCTANDFHKQFGLTSTNTLHKQFAQTFGANTLCKHFAQTSTLHKQFVQTNTLHKQFAQVHCTNSLDKQILQTLCANKHFVQTTVLNNLCKHFAPVVCAKLWTNSLHKQAQVLCKNSLCKHFVQTTCANKHFAQTVCVNSLHKHFAQTCSELQFASAANSVCHCLAAHTATHNGHMLPCFVEVFLQGVCDGVALWASSFWNSCGCHWCPIFFAFSWHSCHTFSAWVHLCWSPLQLSHSGSACCHMIAASSVIHWVLPMAVSISSIGTLTFLKANPHKLLKWPWDNWPHPMQDWFTCNACSDSLCSALCLMALFCCMACTPSHSSVKRSPPALDLVQTQSKVLHSVASVCCWRPIGRCFVLVDKVHGVCPSHVLVSSHEANEFDTCQFLPQVPFQTLD